MHLQMIKFSAKTFFLLTVCACMMMLSGCGGAGALRNAQDAFNQAAALDTKQLLEKPHGIQPSNNLDAALATEKPEIYYRAALDYLESINEMADKSSLQRDGLWTTKIMLEALCHWKLGHYEQARALASKGEKLATETSEPRDKVVLTILPALIKIDQAKLLTEGTPPDEGKLRRLLLDQSYGARKHIDEAQRLTDNRPDLETYISQVELSMYQVWDVGIGLNDSEESRVIQLLCNLHTQSLAAGADRDGITTLINVWKRAFRASFKPEQCR